MTSSRLRPQQPVDIADSAIVLSIFSVSASKNDLSDIPIAFVVFRPETATGRIIHERLLGGESTEKHA